MAGRKNRFPKFKAVSAGQMSNGVTSPVTNVEGLDSIAYQTNFTGAPTGAFTVQVSVDYTQDFLGNVLNAGTWNTVTLVGTFAPAGSAGSFYIPLPNLFAGPWVRLLYTSTATGTQTITTVADVAGSLAGTYFLLTDANSTHKYLIWFKVSGSGVAPSLSGYTAEEVDIATGDTAATIATAAAAVIDALAGFDAAAVGAIITATNTASGPFVIARNGATLPTGFAFAGVTGAGLLDAFITGKMV